MRTARLLCVLAALILTATAAGTARSEAAGPTGLHGFLLRADESAETNFSDTPSFAWNPVPGAIHYEFQLSLSSTFRDNAVVWSDSTATTPVEAPPITLPWITGNPHSLYARVRAITPAGATPWSASYGFDMTPPPPPTPLQPSYPGLLRWNAVAGASGYQIWDTDDGKIEFSTSDTLDERELYIFHPTAAYIGTVHWRVRALRLDASGRLNGIPAVQYGAWSSVYTSTNPAVTTGQITLKGTVSDVFSDGSPSSPAHRLMPAFVWSGNQTLGGTTASLFRVEVFTDRQCINRVYTGAVVGSPAYSPRPQGPLQLPTSLVDLVDDSAVILPDSSSEPPSFALDGEKLTANESLPPVSPTTSVPGAPGDATTTTSSSSDSGSSDSGSSSSSSSSAGSSGATSVFKSAPIDIWDTNWPEGGYYWTVIPVHAVSPGGVQTTVSGTVASGATILPVADSTGFKVGDSITIGTGATKEDGNVTAVSNGAVTLAAGLKSGHGVGEAVLHASAPLEYDDMELPQDVCAAGRVQRFGKASQPALTSSGGVFATGLSSTGRLTSAVNTTKFYGSPLVSWMPAFGAEAYEVQWSKSQSPFVAQTDPATGQLGRLTYSTSSVLPLTPGTWWYRVRGFDYSLPTGTQQMTWSAPVRLVVAAPQFALVGGSSGAGVSGTTQLRTIVGGGISLGVPANWTRVASAGSIDYHNPITHADVAVSRSTLTRGSSSFSVWKNAVVKLVTRSSHSRVTATVVTLPVGKAVKMTLEGQKDGTTVDEVQYYVDAGSKAYSIVFTAPAQRFVTDASTFAKIVASLKLAS